MVVLTGVVADFVGIFGDRTPRGWCRNCPIWDIPADSLDDVAPRRHARAADAVCDRARVSEAYVREPARHRVCIRDEPDLRRRAAREDLFVPERPAMRQGGSGAGRADAAQA